MRRVDANGMLLNWVTILRRRKYDDVGESCGNRASERKEDDRVG